MRVYITSVGEKTTQICKEQLEKFGLEVVMLDEKESWEDKYKRFISEADEDCIRIDADIIPNKNIEWLKECSAWTKNEDFLEEEGYENYILMAQFEGYDFYKNDVGVIGIVFYSKEALDIIRKNLDKIDWRRPEATAWRLPEINDRTYTHNGVIFGMHGFFQTKEDLDRHCKHKVKRKQIDDYDFDLADKLLKL